MVPKLRVCAVLFFAAVCSGFLAASRAVPGQAEETEPFSASVRVTGTVLNTVKPLIFGDNIEWTNCGMGFWLPAEQAFDDSLVEWLRLAGTTHLRYPGGTLSDFFDWQKAVGQQRQAIPNPFSEPEKGRPEFPHFGPEEFMTLCRRLNIAATITLNAGTGSAADAAAWVKYFRDQNFPVASYAVGNEIYMADKNEPVKELPIHKTPREYVDFYRQCKAAIDEQAPGTKLGVIGLLDTGNIGLNKHPDWMQTVVGELGDKVDFIDLHNGYAPVIRASRIGLFSRVYPDDEFAECFMGASVYVRDNIEQTKAFLAQSAPEGGRHIELQITEYGPLVYPIVPKRMAQDAAWNRSLAGALYQACLFNVFLAEPKLTSANHLPLCQDVFGALIGIRGAYPQRKTWRNIVYYVVQMYSEMQHREVLQTEVSAPVYSTRAIGIVPKMRDVPYLDAGAYRTADGQQLTLFLINRSAGRDAQVDIDAGCQPAVVESIRTLAADSYLAENSPEHPDVVVPRTTPAPQAGEGRAVRLTVPRHSLAVVSFCREL